MNDWNVSPLETTRKQLWDLTILKDGLGGEEKQAPVMRKSVSSRTSELVIDLRAASRRN